MRCYCAGACPDGAVNNTCLAADDAWCFASVEETYDDTKRRWGPEWTYGCLQPQETGYMQCKSDKTFDLATIECCRDADHCNRDLKPMYDEGIDRKWVGDDDTVHQMALLISVTLSLIIFVIVIAVVYLRYRKRLVEEQRNTDDILPDYETLISGNGHGMAETSSGSGSGKPFLAQRTIAREIAVFETVGQGRYGLVKRGNYHGQSVAVKVFFTPEEASWQREKQVYEMCRLQHPNILGFIAADITSSNGVRGCTEMWLITEFHKFGSLHDYLKIQVQSPTETLQMCLSIVQGLDYLHKEVIATSIRPAIAHRDIKSKNILVRADGLCCIADFGLAVMFSTGQGEKREFLDVLCTRQGTRRYMSPEVLAEQLDVCSFEAFKQSDMYSLGLVLWEVALRCATGEKLQDYEEYAIPYAGMVPNDPSFEDMHQLVCEEEARPPLPERWSRHKSLSVLQRLMRDCWRQNPAARLRALNVKKHLTAALAAERRGSPQPVQL